jgi:2-keto-3-deoxy-L-fuconate dehydrogenase
MPSRRSKRARRHDAGADVTDVAVERVAREAGERDVLFNCAGFVHHGTIMECTEADWDRSFDINIKSMYRVTRALLPGMLKQGKGSVINMASIASSLRGIQNRFVYGTTKAAVLGFTKAIAADYVKQGIRCNAVYRGRSTRRRPGPHHRAPRPGRRQSHRPP